QFDRELAAGRHGVASIHYDVQDDLLKVRSIHHQSAGGIEFQNELDVFAHQAGQNRVQLANDLVWPQRYRTNDFLAAEGKQLPRESARAFRSIQNFVAVAAIIFIRAKLVFQQLRVTANHAQQIVEVMRHSASEPSQRLHFLRLKKLALQLTMLRLVQQHAKDAFSVPDPDQVGKIKTLVKVSVVVLETHLHVPDGALCPQQLIKFLPLLGSGKKSKLHAALADYIFSLEADHAEQVFIDAEENSFQRDYNATYRALAEDGGKPLFRLLKSNLGQLALGNINRGALDDGTAQPIRDNSGAFQNPERRAVSALVTAFVIQNVALRFQCFPEGRALPVRRTMRQCFGLNGLLLGSKPIHVQKGAVAIEQLAFQSGYINRSQIAFKQTLKLPRRRCGRFRLVLKQGNQHAKGNGIFGQVPEHRRHTYPVIIQISCQRKNQAP